MEKTSSKKILFSSLLVFLFYGSGAYGYLMCPTVTSEMVGSCAEECSADSDCEQAFKCCSNGCGHTCTKPAYIPFHPPPLVCPTTSSDTVGTCSEECGSGCTKDGELCCSNGCGHRCMLGVPPSPLCRYIQESVRNSSLIGAYVPQCEEDGSFSAYQCHASTAYCWCVDQSTGVPLSESVRFKRPQCNCSYGGKVYTIGQKFPNLVEGTCGICSCNVSGGVHCINSVCEGEREATASSASFYYSCPAVSATDNAGSCESGCTQHSDCTPPLHCCHNGCGYSCTKPSQIPYIELPSNTTANGCPSPSSVPCLDKEDDDSGSKEDDDNGSKEASCLDRDNVCQSDSICCENTCSAGVCLSTTDSTPCFTAVQIAVQSNSSQQQLLGRFTPLCTTQGLFRSIQCHEHYCWCVDVQSGRPLSDLVSFEQANVLKCAACVYNGVEYEHLETFPSGDNCNTCTCIGGTVSCSRVDCVDYEEVNGHDDGWGHWYSVLVACAVIVVVLVAIIIALLVGVMMLMKQNNGTHRHYRLKEDVNILEEQEMMEYYGGQESVELKVPVADVVKANTSAT